MVFGECCIGQQGQKITSKVFEKLRFEYAMLLSDTFSGEGNPRFGKLVSKETREAIGSANRGRKHPIRSDEYRKKLSASLTGRKHTESHRRKISEGKKGSIPWNKGRTGVYSEETRSRIGVKKGTPPPNKGKKMTPEQNKRNSDAQRNRKKVQCPYCNKIIDACNFKRWHGDKCKHKENQ